MDQTKVRDNLQNLISGCARAIRDAEQRCRERPDQSPIDVEWFRVMRAKARACLNALKANDQAELDALLGDIAAAKDAPCGHRWAASSDCGRRTTGWASPSLRQPPAAVPSRPKFTATNWAKAGSTSMQQSHPQTQRVCLTCSTTPCPAGSRTIRIRKFVLHYPSSPPATPPQSTSFVTDS